MPVDTSEQARGDGAIRRVSARQPLHSLEWSSADCRVAVADYRTAMASMRRVSEGRGVFGHGETVK